LQILWVQKCVSKARYKRIRGGGERKNKSFFSHTGGKSKEIARGRLTFVVVGEVSIEPTMSKRNQGGTLT